MVGYLEEGRTETRYNAESCGKIRAGNIVEFELLKQGNYVVERSEGLDRGIPKAGVSLGWTHQKVRRHQVGT